MTEYFILRISECSGASMCPAVSTRAVKKKRFLNIRHI